MLINISKKWNHKNVIQPMYGVKVFPNFLFFVSICFVSWFSFVVCCTTHKTNRHEKKVNKLFKTNTKTTNSLFCSRNQPLSHKDLFILFVFFLFSNGNKLITSISKTKVVLRKKKCGSFPSSSSINTNQFTTVS